MYKTLIGISIDDEVCVSCLSRIRIYGKRGAEMNMDYHHSIEEYMLVFEEFDEP